MEAKIGIRYSTSWHNHFSSDISLYYAYLDKLCMLILIRKAKHEHPGHECKACSWKWNSLLKNFLSEAVMKLTEY